MFLVLTTAPAYPCGLRLQGSEGGGSCQLTRDTPDASGVRLNVKQE